MSAREWGRDDRRRIATRDFPEGVKALVDERQGGRFCVECHVAGRTPPADEPLVLDHMQPLSRGGTNHWSNLRWLCEGCNLSRGNRRDVGVPRWARGR